MAIGPASGPRLPPASSLCLAASMPRPPTSSMKGQRHFPGKTISLPPRRSRSRHTARTMPSGTPSSWLCARRTQSPTACSRSAASVLPPIPRIPISALPSASASPAPRSASIFQESRSSAAAMPQGNHPALPCRRSGPTMQQHSSSRPAGMQMSATASLKRSWSIAEQEP
jgi:hypothetical protein